MNEPLISKIRVKFGGGRILILLLIILLLIYSSVSTRLIPAMKQINQTDANNNTVVMDAIYSYSFGDYIVKQIPFELENKAIPKNAPSSWVYFIIICLCIALVIIGMFEQGKTILTRFEIENEAKLYLDWMKQNKKISEYREPYDSYLQKFRINDGERKADYWLLGTEEQSFRTGEWTYRVLVFNPFSGKLEADIETTHKFTGNDTCPGCGGRFCSEKIVDITGYLQWKEHFSPRIR